MIRLESRMRVVTDLTSWNDLTADDDMAYELLACGVDGYWPDQLCPRLTAIAFFLSMELE